jgi:hypothetical protein
MNETRRKKESARAGGTSRSSTLGAERIEEVRKQLLNTAFTALERGQNCMPFPTWALLSFQIIPPFAHIRVLNTGKPS